MANIGLFVKKRCKYTQERSNFAKMEKPRRSDSAGQNGLEQDGNPIGQGNAVFAQSRKIGKSCCVNALTGQDQRNTGRISPEIAGGDFALGGMEGTVSLRRGDCIGRPQTEMGDGRCVDRLVGG